MKNEKTTNFRTWKSGKSWLYATTVVAALAGGGFVVASPVAAATTATASSAATSSATSSSAAASSAASSSATSSSTAASSTASSSAAASSTAASIAASSSAAASSTAASIAASSSAAASSAAASSAAASSAANSAYIDSNGDLANGYIVLAVSNDDSAGGDGGRFTLGTTGGDPTSSTDNDQILLYGHPDPNTSYTTVSVDGNQEVYDATNDTYDVNNSSNTSSENLGNGITVKQVLSLVSNDGTGENNVLQVQYIVTNTDSVSHNVGLRIMLDTDLADNDGAPFRVPGTGNVTTETEYTGSQIPPYWQAFDSLSNPGTITQGTLLSDPNNKPDMVQFTNWAQVSDSNWNTPITPGASFNTDGGDYTDSAVTVTWNEQSLAPGASRVYTTEYGLTSLTQNLLPPLVTSIYGSPTAVTDSSGILQPVAFTAYVQNTGTTPLNNAFAEIVLPAGITLQNGELRRINYSTLAPNQQEQASWDLNFGDIAPGTYNISVLVGADGVATKTLTRQIVIPAHTTPNSTSSNNVPLSGPTVGSRALPKTGNSNTRALVLAGLITFGAAAVLAYAGNEKNRRLLKLGLSVIYKHI